MLLSNNEIRKCIDNGEIVLENLDMNNIGPDSVDIRLDKRILVAKKTGKVIDPRNGIDMEFDEYDLSKEPYALKPGDFVLASSYERIGLSNHITAQLEGRSSLGRLGIVIHMTAGLIHAGWGLKKPSALTLEISSVNPNPVLLHYKMKIAQLSFMLLRSPASTGYDECKDSKYVGQSDVTASKMHHDYEIKT